MDLNFSNLHHAYLVVGSPNLFEEKLHHFFLEQGLKLKSSPDFFVIKEAVFGIEEARKLSETAVRKAFTEKKVFLIASDKITLEAQNALLKTFEEPIAHTHFFLVVRDENVVLPTLRSRTQVLRVAQDEEVSEAKKFLTLPIKDRLTFVKKFVDNEKNLSAFLDELLRYVRGQGVSPKVQEEIYKQRLVSDDRGAAPRIILEHLALVLP